MRHHTLLSKAKAPVTAMTQEPFIVKQIIGKIINKAFSGFGAPD